MALRRTAFCAEKIQFIRLTYPSLGSSPAEMTRMRAFAPDLPGCWPEAPEAETACATVDIDGDAWLKRLMSEEREADIGRS